MGAPHVTCRQWEELRSRSLGKESEEKALFGTGGLVAGREVWRPGTVREPWDNLGARAGQQGLRGTGTLREGTGRKMLWQQSQESVEGQTGRAPVPTALTFHAG